VVVLLSGCGGGGGKTATTTTNTVVGTTPGSYTITFTATCSVATVSRTMNLTVR
jgi:hypothetical protein